MTDQNTIQSILDSTAYDKEGKKVGKVGQLFVDNESGEPTFVSVNTGLFGHNSSLVPIAGAKLNGDELHLAHDKDLIADAPNISDEDEGLEQSEEQRLYEHYGLTRGAATGTAATTGAAAGTAATTKTETETAKADTTKRDAAATDDAVIRSEEQMNVSKDTVASGRARLRKYVVTDTKTVEVPVSHEEVRVEREAISPEEAKKLGTSRLGEQEAEVILHEERVNVDKETVPVEKINLKKETVTENQQVSEELRKEKVEFEGADKKAAKK